jgi:diacylglycerol kinase family enzyme
MYVLVNPVAGGGRALERWKRIEPEVRRRVGPFRCNVAAGQIVIGECVGRELARGETDFIAAGGDGTVNLVMSTIVDRAPEDVLGRIRLGAIGLGSSNDFHKPADPSRQIDGIPVRIDFEGASRHDVGVLTYRQFASLESRREWLINASVGTTAEANRFFNSPNRVLRRLKRSLPSLAMVYAAVRTIFRFRPETMQIAVDGRAEVRVPVRNLGVVKNPHFTGALRYGSPHEPGGGRFYVHLIDDVPLARLAVLLCRLARGRFYGCGTRSWSASQVSVRSERPFAVERDGEVVTAKEASFSLLPEAILVCP